MEYHDDDLEAHCSSTEEMLRSVYLDSIYGYDDMGDHDDDLEAHCSSVEDMLRFLYLDSTYGDDDVE